MPPTIIEYPNIAEAHVRATYELLTGFFDGNSHILGQKTIDFPKLEADDLVQDIRELDPQVSPAIRLGILTASVVDAKELKCEDPNATKAWGYEMRAIVQRDILVAAIIDRSNPQANYREAIKTYDKVFTIFATQHALFAARKIFRVILDPLPTQIPNDNFAIVSGRMRCEVRVAYTRD